MSMVVQMYIKIIKSISDLHHGRDKYFEIIFHLL